MTTSPKLLRVLAATVTAGWIGTVSAADITGAGATFPYPIYAKWADAYKQKTGIGLNYQSIGSGGGIKQIIAKTVDFGASDMPLGQEDLEKNGLLQFPAIMGGVVPAYSVAGIKPGELRFTGKLIADIYLGKIKKWNDATIKELNPNVNLPNQDISVIHRSDGSGTTFLFTNFLSKSSPEWKEKVGEGTSVKWATGVGGKGNEGVAAYLKQISGAIGYVEYAYAKQNNLAYGQMQNRGGKFVAPTEDSFKAAASGADWSKVPGMALVLTDQAGANAWPITGASFILLHRKPQNPENAQQVLKFFDWAFQSGDKMASDLDYAPIPDALVKQVHVAWKDIKGPSGQSVYVATAAR